MAGPPIVSCLYALCGSRRPWGHVQNVPVRALPLFLGNLKRGADSPTRPRSRADPFLEPGTATSSEGLWMQPA